MGNTKYTKTYCRKIAKKCSSRSEFCKVNHGAYANTLKNNWMDEFFPDSPTRRGKIFWTKENCRIEAAKYSTKSEFARKCNRAYRISLDNGWLPEFGFGDTSRSTKCHARKKTWTKEECAEVYKGCNGRIEFIKKKASAYRAAKENGWLDEICGTKNSITKERFRNQAAKYKSSSAFKKYATKAYTTCLKNGWLDEFFPSDTKPVEALPTAIRHKTVRQMMLDYVEANGPQTRDQMRKVMLTICGQHLDDRKWGVGWWNNTSFGTSVFLPARKDRRYLKPVRSFDSSEVKYDIATI